ncbi:MAG: SH3 domain-containing protein [Lachnospiraceae bacterium]|nr:SH3 domain-containing protein [Lachnospiraceae bacterium]
MRKYGKKAGSILLAALMGVSGLTGAYGFTVSAEEETEAETVAETAAETEVEVTELEITVDGETLTVTNATGLDILMLTYETGSTADASEANAAEAEEDNEAEDAAEEAGTDGEAETEVEVSAPQVIATEADGTTHTFASVDVSGLSDLTIIEKIGFLFLYGTDASGEKKNFYEVADEVTLDEPVTMYATGQVNIREAADGSSALLGSVARGGEVQVVGGTSAWFKITQDDITGYVAARYLTMEESEAEAAVAQESEARSALEAAAAAAAAASSASSSGGATEVSREPVYDCDGSGHGYYIVTYSDGSVAYVDF